MLPVIELAGIAADTHRRAVVRWSDGTEGVALSRYGDERLICEGDHGNSRLMAPGYESVRIERDRTRMRGT
jgi:hypothetical protein